MRNVLLYSLSYTLVVYAYNLHVSMQITVLLSGWLMGLNGTFTTN